jgi:hypothetical protein
MASGMLALVAMSPAAKAALVSGWGLEIGSGSGATIAEWGPGMFSSTIDSNTIPRALIDVAGQNTPAVVGVGDTIILSGRVKFSESNLSNQQFRFGLFNINTGLAGTLSNDRWIGSNPAGWLGHMVQMGGTGGGGLGTTSLKGRAGTGTTTFMANSDTYIVGTTDANFNTSAGTYAFDLTILRTTATTQNISYEITQLSGGSYFSSGSFTDSGASASLASYNAVGFLLNTSTGPAQFTNVDVSVVPEPPVAAYFLFIGGICLLRRSRLRSPKMPCAR